MVIEDLATLPAPRSLESFAGHLARLLEVNTTEHDRDEGYLIHVAGYGRAEDGTPRPQMWFVRNVEHMDEKGEYFGRTKTFTVTEDFWPNYTDSLPDATASQGVTIPAEFMNGFTPGRIAFNEFGRNVLGCSEGYGTTQI